jgi:mRNA interferase MazF
MKGKIVLVPFPFTDLTAAKLRPALVIHEGEKDVILAFISSKIPSQPSEADVLLLRAHSGFDKTGLKVNSVYKLSTVIPGFAMGSIRYLVGEL